jgi:hypothetical protein
MFTPPKRTTGHLKRSPVALVTREKYGADTARLHRIFCFLACSLQSITQKSIEHRIACNCGAFAPYFFYFWLASALNQTGSFAVAL